jgi:hypothetical protein
MNNDPDPCPDPCPECGGIDIIPITYSYYNGCGLDISRKYVCKECGCVWKNKSERKT